MVLLDNSRFLFLWAKGRAIVSGVKDAILQLRQDFDPSQSNVIFNSFLNRADQLESELNFIQRNHRYMTYDYKRSASLAVLTQVRKLFDETREIKFYENGRLVEVSLHTEFTIIHVNPERI